MFGKEKIKRDKGSLELAKRIGGKHFSTVSEFDDNGEERIIGHGGSVNFSFGDIVVISNGKETFRSTQKSFRAAELMSGNGVRLSGIDREGNKRSVLAIYNKF